ncbi:peroxiredoxin [Candidatus Gracilibacteria bacterium]|nr:peroxiredoxin [Candidatus Gracilibacteria bacterium]
MKINLENRFQAITSSGETAELSFKDIISYGDYTLLYFYPADNTPGCTLENKSFSSLKNDFQDLGIVLVGVSKNSIASHKDFIENHDLQIDLISDPELILHKELGAYGEKNNYGKIVTGVIRSTFLLNKNGEIIQEWRNVRAKGHAEKVLREIHLPE